MSNRHFTEFTLLLALFLIEFSLPELSLSVDLTLRLDQYPWTKNTVTACLLCAYSNDTFDI